MRWPMVRKAQHAPQPVAGLDRRRFICALGATAAVLAAPQVRATVTGSVAADGLRDIARRHGLLYGAATGSALLAQDGNFARAFAADCGVVVPEGEGKWAATQPASGQFDFTGLDRLLAFADTHRMQFRGHCLVWHEAVPDWLEPALAQADAAQARALLEQHIAAVVSHTRGRAHS